MRWRKPRKWAKWTCTLAAGAAVALVVFSRFCGLDYAARTNGGDTDWSIGVENGQVLLSHMDGVRAIGLSQPLRWRVRWSPDWYWGYAGEKIPYGAAWTWHAGVLYVALPTGWMVGTSVLYPVALTLIPAAVLWYADRRRLSPGLCHKCSYDRRGLAADAKCPECGTVPTLARA